MILTNKHSSGLPAFYCVGTQKAGTTSLYRILSQHPDIIFPVVKETHFFCAESEYRKGLNYYKDFFKTACTEKILGEIDPNYMYFPAVPRRIYDASGAQIKLIFILRNPVDRMISHYLMCKQKGYESKGFFKALELEETRISSSEINNTRFSYLGRSLYTTQVKRFLKLFPMENMMFIIFESHLIGNRKKTIEELLGFLDLPLIDMDVSMHANVTKQQVIPALGSLIYGQGRSKQLLKSILPFSGIRARLKKLIEVPVSKKNIISLEERAVMMQKYFHNDVKELESLTGLDLHIWYEDLLPMYK